MGTRSLRAYYYALFALIILIMSWESGLANAALITPVSSIPEESIRIRILANSDSPQDQWIKKEVQRAVVESINGWDETYADIEQARTVIRSKLPELERIVAEQLEQYGFDYASKVELGIVDFPAKVFGKETYPAGKYEALRITLGAGNGANWWCVMFPPLCFGGDTVKAKDAGAKGAQKLAAVGLAGEAETDADDAIDGKADKSDRVDKAGEADKADDARDEVEVKFFLVELFEKLVDFIKSLF